MDGQRQRSGGGRRRRRRSRAEPTAAEPVMIAARRPNSPLLTRPGRRALAASVAPSNGKAALVSDAVAPAPAPAESPSPPRRVARIVTAGRTEVDDSERSRLRLLERLMLSETRGSISRAANDYLQAGFLFPEEQPVQLQLLEHFDEERAREAITVLARLLDEQDAHKLPVLLQRLRRLEEHGDEAPTRDAAAELRRSLR